MLLLLLQFVAEERKKNETTWAELALNAESLHS